jgi:Sec-independent protein translocase protein TatA
MAFIGPGGPEVLVVMLVLLLMFGSKDAPRIFRKINEMINSIRSTAEGFKREIMYSDLGVDEPTRPVYDNTDEDHDDDYEYDDGYDPYEPDYSDETFDGLEEDLKDAGAEAVAEEPVAEPEPNTNTDDEDDDARKA